MKKTKLFLTASFLSLGVFLTFSAEETTIVMQGLSPVWGSAESFDGTSVEVELGNPFMVESTDGDEIFMQGIIDVISGNETTNSVEFLKDDNIDVSILFDQKHSVLTLKLPAGEKGRIVIVDINGKNILDNVVDNSIASIDLSHLSTGIYMAALAQNNYVIKTLKFIIK